MAQYHAVKFATQVKQILNNCAEMANRTKTKGETSGLTAAYLAVMYRRCHHMQQVSMSIKINARVGWPVNFFFFLLLAGKEGGGVQSRKNAYHCPSLKLNVFMAAESEGSSELARYPHASVRERCSLVSNVAGTRKAYPGYNSLHFWLQQEAVTCRCHII